MGAVPPPRLVARRLLVTVAAGFGRFPWKMDNIPEIQPHRMGTSADHRHAEAAEQLVGDDYVAWLDTLWAQRLSGALSGATDRKPDLTIGILLWPGFPMMSLTGIVEPLRHAGDFADNSRPVHCRWSVLGEPGTSATASCGIRIHPDVPYVNPTDFDYVVVIGGLLGQMASAPARHRHYLHVAASAGVPMVGVCTGVFVLAHEGLLAGRKVCVHPFHQQDFRAAFPSLRITTRDDFIVDRNRITVPGGISILSLMTGLIRSHCGADRAAKVAHQLALTNRPSVNEFDRAQVSDFRHATDSRLQRAVVLIEGSMGKDAVPDEIAAQVGISARQFSRLFKDQFGMTPKKFIIETRLRYALWLIRNSRLAMTTIAYETGFADCAHLTTSFKARYGQTPTDCRRSNVDAGSGSVLSSATESLAGHHQRPRVGRLDAAGNEVG
jgi:transcriptional regulator GlxA family with amidase domain